MARKKKNLLFSSDARAPVCKPGFHLEVMAQMRESLRVTQTHAVTILIENEKSFDPTVQRFEAWKHFSISCFLSGKGTQFLAQGCL